MFLDIKRSVRFLCRSLRAQYAHSARLTRRAPFAYTSAFRSNKGSVTPFLAVFVILMLGTLGISLDLMRDFEAVNQLQFAAQSAAIHGLSNSVNADGSYSNTGAKENITTAINSASNSNWNTAQSGPQNNIWSQPVNFANSDIQFVNNPDDSNEFFLQLTARRSGSNALEQFFLPTFYTTLTNAGIPASVQLFSAQNTQEVLGQPASRVGPGAPAGSSFYKFAVLPLAISNTEFANYTSPSLTGTNPYTIEIFSGAAFSNHIKGCLVNVSTTGNSSQYYSLAQGNSSIDQLEGLLGYFGAPVTVNTVTPGLLECGSILNAFNPTDPSFISRATEITKALQQLSSLQQNYIVPVISSDPVFSGTAPSTVKVIGFAYLHINSVSLNSSNGQLSMSINIADNVLPVPNTSSVSGFSSIPGNTNNSLSPAIYPFTPRAYDSAANGVLPRQRGVVLAPTFSPRTI